jgi:transcription antitermination factor NusG
MAAPIDWTLEGWCILRTKGGRTLRLAQTLAEDGYEVWTPVETRTLRIPRANARRQVKLPIMPSYVFAKAFQLIDLIQLADLAVKPRRGKGLMKPAHDNFRVMRCLGGIPFIPDAELNALRQLEAKLTPRQMAARTFGGGATVRVEGGSFGGMSGTVETSNRAQTTVRFGERFVVKIPTCILTENMSGEASPVMDIAA